jgi:hypothetical protein
MKKIPILVMAFIFSAGILMACSPDYVKDIGKQDANGIKSSFDKLNQTEAISLTIDNVDAASISLSFVNSGSDDFSFGDYYALEYQKDDNWYVLPYAAEEDIGFNDIAYELAAGQTVAWHTDFSGFYGELAPGHYRIIKDVMGDTDGEIFSFAAEFEIK